MALAGVSARTGPARELSVRLVVKATAMAAERNGLGRSSSLSSLPPLNFIARRVVDVDVAGDDEIALLPPRVHCGWANELIVKAETTLWSPLLTPATRHKRAADAMEYAGFVCFAMVSRGSIAR